MIAQKVKAASLGGVHYVDLVRVEHESDRGRSVLHLLKCAMGLYRTTTRKFHVNVVFDEFSSKRFSIGSILRRNLYHRDPSYHSPLAMQFGFGFPRIAKCGLLQLFLLIRFRSLDMEQELAYYSS